MSDGSSETGERSGGATLPRTRRRKCCLVFTLTSCALLWGVPLAATPNAPTPHAPTPHATMPQAPETSVAPSASAQPLADSLSGPALEAYEAARLLVEQGDSAGALIKFRLAHELSKDPRLLWNMAVCEKNLRHYARMQSLLRSYLSSAREFVTPEREEEVQAALTASASFVGTLRIEVKPAGVSVEIDGLAAGVTPMAELVAVDLGTHRLRLTKPGYQDATLEVAIHGGDTTTVTRSLKAVERRATLQVIGTNGAQISIDGQPRGVGRWSGDWPPGSHRLVVAARGHKTFEAWLDLPAGTSRTMQINLEPLDGPRWWPWVLGGVAALGATAAIATAILYEPPTVQRPAEAGSLHPGIVTISLSGGR